MKAVSPNDLYDFFLAWFKDRVTTHRRESTHFVLKIDGVRDNITINTGLNPMATGTVQSLLRKCDIPKEEFEAVFATSRSFKQFKKHGRPKESEGSPFL